MKTSLRICDICLNEGVIRLATHRYRPDPYKIFDCCTKHEKEMRKYHYVIIKLKAPGGYHEV